MSKEENLENEKITCGIVMPISPIDNCSADHWSEVLTILKEVIKDAEFEPNLVSDAGDSGIIQKRIIQNLYNNEIVVCDVSAKNPNVMFELGIRLAFDKPTIIIKDDKTDYSFDTSVIEHIVYPRDLRFTKILKFKELLKSKIKSTYEKSKNDPNYTTFLKHFGEYKITQLEKTEVTSQKYLLSAIADIHKSIKEIKYNQIDSKEPFKGITRETTVYKIIRNEIETFKKKNKIKGDLDIFTDDKLTDDLFEYLRSLDIVRENFDNLYDLKHMIDDVLFPF